MVKNNQGMTFQLFEFDLMELMMSVCDCANKLNLRGESRLSFIPKVSE